MRTDANPPTGLSLGTAYREEVWVSGRHITISGGFFMDRTQNTGRMIIKLTGFTSVLKRGDQFQAEVKYLVEEHRVVMTDFLVEHFIHCHR